ncbi:MAG: phosphatase PAP2 family protein [Promethearchaeota archaeon]|nr:MAG: phosphatase PAP2 family protein [Candidatus Lokiarchaeota archaeon]
MTVETSFKIFIKRLEDWDFKLFLGLYQSKFSKRKIVKKIAEIYSFFGNVFFWGLIWLILGIYGFITKEYFLFVLMTGGFQQSIILHVIIRYVIVRRNRPYITLKEKGVIQEDDLIKEHKSFPSGHVTFFLFFGCIFAFAFDSWIFLLVMMGLDVIMAVSRVILGVHFPIDVIFGFIFGALFALLYLGITYQFWIDFYYFLGRILSPF